MNDLIEKKLTSGVQKMGLSLGGGCEQKLVSFLHLLQKWNKAYNLTAIHSMEKMLTHHLLDSLAVAPYLKGKTVLDVGTGAGFPGVPLALYYPDKKFILLDSIGKKIRFLLQAQAELEICNIEPIQSRVEKFNAKHCFDVIICRAVGNMVDIIQASTHLISQNGQWLFMKGVYPQQELDQIREFNAELTINVQAVHIPGVDAERHLVFVTGMTNRES